MIPVFFSQLSRWLQSFLQKPEKVFLILASVFGLVLVFLTPPFQVPDEPAHFFRAYQVSNLTFVSQPFQLNSETRYGSQLPESLTAADTLFIGNVAGHAENRFPLHLFRLGIDQQLQPQKTQQTLVEASAIYSPIVYVPQAIGITIGKLFSAPPLVMIWLGRIMNLAFWILIMYVALRLLPFAKWAMVILILNPVAIFLSASLSPDVTNISFAFLFVSLILATFNSKVLISKRMMFALLGVLAVLSLSKPVNLVFALLLFAIPWKRFATKWKFIRFCIIGILLSGFLFVFWNYQVKDILVAAVKSQSGGVAISDQAQLLYILHTPLSYLHVVFNNYVLAVPGTSGDAVLGTFFGVFGWLDTSIPLWTIMVYLLTLFLALLYQMGRGITLTRTQKLFFVITFGLGFLGNITAMYFNSTAVGASVISGVQGRYFIAFSILALGIFTARKKILQISEKSIGTILFSAMIVILLMMIIRIALRYYA